MLQSGGSHAGFGGSTRGTVQRYPLVYHEYQWWGGGACSGGHCVAKSRCYWCLVFLFLKVSSVMLYHLSVELK